MLFKNLNTIFVCVAGLLSLSWNFSALATEDSDTTQLVQNSPSKDKPDDESTSTQATEKGIHPSDLSPSRITLGVGVGFVRAYEAAKGGSLRANGVADLKLSYLTDYKLQGGGIYTTLRYLPFNIAPDSGDNILIQEYSGVVSVYAAGVEWNFLSRESFGLFTSLELAIFQAKLRELIPITDASPPINRFGALGMLGLEFRYKPSEKVHLGTKLHFGNGKLALASLLFNASLSL